MHPLFPILVVDDDEAMALIISRAARDSFPEAQFTFISSASQAQALLADPQTTRPRLLLLDVNLNDAVNGLQLLDQIRASPPLFTLPVIMISADECLPPVYEAYQRGATSFAHKPFSMADWSHFLAGLRQYWFKTVTLPPRY